MIRVISYTGPMARRVQNNAYLYAARKRLNVRAKSNRSKFIEALSYFFCHTIWR